MSKTAVEEIRPDLTSFPISSIRNLIQLCWASRPKTRPTFTEILHVLETHCKEEVQIKDEMKVEVERKLELENFEKKKATISRSRDNVKKFKAPVVLMRAKEFIGLSKMTSFEELRDDDGISKTALKSFDQMEVSEPNQSR